MSRDLKLESILSQVIAACGDVQATLTVGEAMIGLGLRRAARLPVVAAMHRLVDHPVLLVTDRADHALNLYDELGLWCPKDVLLYFPEPSAMFYEKAGWGETTRRERLVGLAKLAAYHIPGAQNEADPHDKHPLLVAPVRALMTRTLPRREFLKATRSLRIHQTVQPEALARSLVILGYEYVNTVILPGQFTRRGGILDVWPMAAEKPTRIEFFGDEIETLRNFDPASQRTIQTQDRLLITPAREFLPPAGPESMPESFSEFDIPRLHPSPASLLDYLPYQALVFFDDYQVTQDQVAELEEQAIQLRREALAEGTIQPEDPDPFMSWSEIVDSLPRNRAIELGGTESKPEQDTLSSRFVPEPRYGGRVKLFIEHVLDLAQRGEPSLVVSRQSARLRELWAEQHLPQTIDPPQFIDGSLTEGFTLLPVAGPALHLFTDGEIFGWRRPEPRRRPHAVAESPEGSYTDLQIGDYVVHADHGIGVLIGLVTRTIDGSEREYLCVEYADEAQLFVPVHQADRITRYVGADARPPALSRLGSAEWKSVKSHVKEAVQEVAQDLLDLYAQRSVVEGHAFASDGPWQQELEASFPYIETDDQMRVLAEVKRDMERPQPMDRLICGDVGYGKTEVALRAAFKAVVDGKQVAVLVPTTVLAQQHTQTFHQRLAAFPVAVEMLSRFRSPQEQREVIQRLQAGGIDIVIGTHRLFSSDVKFKDLGLLVIDEEQRFGVTHKETLKKMRSEVDVLTMTATPIPRTLYMTLTGVRDISTINTPPEERLPILTHVGPYSPRLVRQAILRELERGGQVFFVHNRVQTINAMHHHLEKLVPEAKITVAHGQMHESMLSERMQQFTDGDVDVLLSTSIIESGLDIPNANTLIVDRADAFGLAQLYQLRGRVGRGAQRAYAYFFRHARRTPTLEGRERLETIAENTQLGAGYSIAMRDLEIRGAGDILGTRQHGHIAAVGFHLYTRLLTEAVHRLRSPSHREIRAIRSQAANVDLPFAASIPVDYVSDKIMRLRLYRRMADIQSQAELDALDEEFRDRFGPPPEPVRNLLYQLKIRLLSEQAGLASIGTESGQLALRYPDNQIPADLPALDSKVRVGKTAVWMPYTQWSDWRDLLVTVLNQLNGSKLVIEP